MGRLSKTNEQFQKEAKENNHKVTVLGVYKEARKKVLKGKK